MDVPITIAAVAPAARQPAEDALTRARGSLAGIGLLLFTACQPAALEQPSWPAPADPMTLAIDAGLEPTNVEHLQTHTHAHLDVIVDGQQVPVPAGIGIDVEAPVGISTELTDDRAGTEYFVSKCAEACLSPLHTHEPGGILHTESIDPDIEPFTLGQFFTEWGLSISEECIGEFCTSDTNVAVYVNGEKQEGDPAAIRLDNHAEIAVIIGTAPAEIPSEWTFFDDQ
jgi:hypothetical protein